MKTNVVIVRQLGSYNVKQRTKDGMFNATHLLRQWNDIDINPKRELSKFWDQDGVKSFIEIMMNEENLHTHLEAYVKSKASRGENSGTWMHPILFTKFAMWLNPKFEYFVIKFVHEQLISFRHLAGDNYKCLAKSLTMFNSVNYSQVAMALNYIVFGRHGENLRQNASEAQLKELNDVEQKLAFAIEMGYIRSFDELLNEMRKMWYKKNF